MHVTNRGQICISKLSIIGSDNVLLPGRRQAIIWTNAAILLIETLRTIFSEIWNEIHAIFIQENAFENVVCKMAVISYRPPCHPRSVNIGPGKFGT